MATKRAFIDLTGDCDDVQIPKDKRSKQEDLIHGSASTLPFQAIVIWGILHIMAAHSDALDVPLLEVAPLEMVDLVEGEEEDDDEKEDDEEDDDGLSKTEQTIKKRFDACFSVIRTSFSKHWITDALNTFIAAGISESGWVSTKNLAKHSPMLSKLFSYARQLTEATNDEAAHFEILSELFEEAFDYCDDFMHEHKQYLEETVKPHIEHTRKHVDRLIVE